MPDDDLAFASAMDIKQMIGSKQVSIVELTEMFLRRIEAFNPKLNAYLTVTGEEAVASAQGAQEALQKGQAVGPLHGIPISIKDLEITNDIRSTMGSAIFKDHVPTQDSVVVERVRKAGAIILGKTNTPEFGASGTTENKLGEPCYNPWNTERTAGGSSGGAGAALAAGLCTLASGSDGGGSIRIPSSFCGLFGIKPSQGRVPRYGGVGTPSYNVHSQSGPMSRTVRDSALLLQVMAGPDGRDPGCMREEPPDFLAGLGQGVRGLRIGWSPDLGYAAVDPEVLEVTSQAARLVEEMGCKVDEADIAWDDPFLAFWDIFSIAAYTSYGHLLETRSQELTDYARNTLEHGKDRTAADYSRSLLQAVQLRSKMDSYFEDHDLLLTPTMAVPAFQVEKHPTTIAGREVHPFWGYLPFTFPINMTGQTAASVPCGYSSDGMPIGLQIIGRSGGEATVLRASAAFEQARPWADKRPPVS